MLHISGDPSPVAQQHGHPPAESQSCGGEEVQWRLPHLLQELCLHLNPGEEGAGDDGQVSGGRGQV